MRIYQSSSLSLPFCIALCLARKASASPPARLGVGVLRPLSVPLPLLFKLMAESRGAGGGMGFLPPTTGRFVGGVGGVGLARIAAPLPLVFATGGGGGGVGLIVGATGGGGGGASSWR